jgi:hypothetical protein
MILVAAQKFFSSTPSGSVLDQPTFFPNGRLPIATARASQSIEVMSWGVRLDSRCQWVLVRSKKVHAQSFSLSILDSFFFTIQADHFSCPNCRLETQNPAKAEAFQKPFANPSHSTFNLPHLSRCETDLESSIERQNSEGMLVSFCGCVAAGRGPGGWGQVATC